MLAEESRQYPGRMRVNMSEESNRTSAARKKRVQRLKKLIILILIISITIPYVCCALLFAKVQHLEDELQNVTSSLDEINSLLSQQQGLLEKWSQETQDEGEGTSPVMEAVDEERIVQTETMQESSDDLAAEAAHKVYLTFDDGPSIYTEDILDILDQYEIKATFFVVGKEDEDSQEALRQIVERGHSLGMHSYSHKYREIYESVESFEEDFTRIQNYLYDITGVRSTLYRFPGGSSNRVSDLDMQDFADYLYEQGVTFYDWNISSGDAASEMLSVQKLVDNATNGIENWETSIILLHDSGDKRTTVEALPIIIENILAMEDTVILPITEDTEPVQHIHNSYTKAKE